MTTHPHRCGTTSHPLRVLILLNKHGYRNSCGKIVETGLLNSAMEIWQFLATRPTITAALEVVADGNAIDKVVTNFKPDIVILEAIWVTPLKLQELVKLHPKVKWVVRVHSEWAFLANEGAAVEWLLRYELLDRVRLGANSRRMAEGLSRITAAPVAWLPNLIMQLPPEPSGWDIIRANFQPPQPLPRVVNIGCFGAIRPLKNQLIQAAAAYQFGSINNVKVKFHVNVGREEQHGENVLRNLRALFAHSPHELVEWEWVPNRQFKRLIETMDVGMQVSLSESFGMVSAEFVAARKPLVVSPAIQWAPSSIQADPAGQQDQSMKLSQVLRHPQKHTVEALASLYRSNRQAQWAWLDFLSRGH